MNKRQREIKMSIAEKNKLVDKAINAGDVSEAEKMLDEIDELQKEYDVIERAMSAGRLTVTENTPEAGTGTEDTTADKALTIMGVKVSEKSLKDFATAFRAGFPKQKTLNETTGADGGYTVPDDIVGLIERFRDAKASLRRYVRVYNVNTDKGSRTYQTRGQKSAFAKVGEAQKIPKKNGPKFGLLEFAIEKFGGWLAITNELIADSDADIVAEVAEWFGDAARITENVEILNAISAIGVTDMTSLDDIKYAYDVTLGQAFADAAAVYTNDSGKHWLGTLKDQNGRDLLQPNPTMPVKQQICSGADIIPLIVIPNADMPNEDVYLLTTDTALVTGKTYYTRSGSGTSQSPYVYTAVQSPSVSDIATYYEKHAGVPMIVGDLYEAVALFDRRRLSLKMSDTASAGTDDDAVNAFDEDLTLVRGILRNDVQARDTGAIVRGRVII